MKNTKLTRFMAHTIKMANKRQQEENRRKKMIKAKAAAQRTWGGHSELPTDTDWEAAMKFEHDTRFGEDKKVKGQNARISDCMCRL